MLRQCGSFNTWRPRQNGCQFAVDIFKFIFISENWILFRIQLKYVSNGPALVQIMAWYRTGSKPLSETSVTSFVDAHMLHSDSMISNTANFPTNTYTAPFSFFRKSDMSSLSELGAWSIYTNVTRKFVGPIRCTCGRSNTTTLFVVSSMSLLRCNQQSFPCIWIHRYWVHIHAFSTLFSVEKKVITTTTITITTAAATTVNY